jgi:uncharacterized membrane protein YhaH (DUF805 family)
LNGLVAVVLLAIPIVYEQVGRWHDLGYSRWMTLLGFAPAVFSIELVAIVGLVVSIALAFIKGDQTDNKYGPSPYRSKFEDS